MDFSPLPLRLDRGEGTFAGAGKSSGNDISYFGDKGLDDDDDKSC